MKVSQNHDLFESYIRVCVLRHKQLRELACNLHNLQYSRSNTDNQLYRLVTEYKQLEAMSTNLQNY